MALDIQTDKELIKNISLSSDEFDKTVEATTGRIVEIVRFSGAVIVGTNMGFTTYDGTQTGIRSGGLKVDIPVSEGQKTSHVPRLGTLSINPLEEYTVADA